MFQALSALISARKFAYSLSHFFLSLQGDDMHRTKAFSQSTGAPTQCVYIYSSLLKLMVIH